MDAMMMTIVCIFFSDWEESEWKCDDVHGLVLLL